MYDNKVTLTLIYGDIKASLEYFDDSVQYDAWYLDGFSPSKNPEMWSLEVAKKLKETSNAETTFATYSVAGLVKRNFTQAGFLIKKSTGFGLKRDMLMGSSTGKAKYQFSRKRICIVGAGIAGCSLAKILAEKGHKVTIFDKEENASFSASGNEILVTYPRLSAHDSPYARFSLQSFLYSSNFYDQLKSKYWKKSGVLMMNFDDNSKKREESLCKATSKEDLFVKLDKETASLKAGVPLNHGGLFFKDAGYIQPKKLCQEILQHENITTKYSEEVLTINTEHGMHEIITNQSKSEFDELCLCNAYDVERFINLDSITKKRGQVSLISTNDKLKNLTFPICAGGYLSPNLKGEHLIGSSYSQLESLDVLDEEHDGNKIKINAIYDGELEVLAGRVGFRTVTKDRMPISGKLNGIYINVGHGSRGSTSAPLCSQHIADMIDKTPLPFGSQISYAIRPERFYSKISE